DAVDAAVLGIGVQGIPAVVGGECLGGTDATGGGVEEVDGLLGCLAGTDIPLVEPGLQVIGEDRVNVLVQQATAVEFTEDGGDATGAVDILHVVVRVRCDLGQAGHALGQHVDVSQVEVDLTLLGGGEDVQDGVGGTTHGHIECHGV